MEPLFPQVKLLTIEIFALQLIERVSKANYKRSNFKLEKTEMTVEPKDFKKIRISFLRESVLGSRNTVI